MKSYKFTAIFLSLLLILTTLTITTRTSAALTPVLTLSAVGNNSVQVTINNADPGASVMMNYNSATTTSNWTSLGLTNSSGYLSTTINSGAYGVVSNSPVFVTVDGAQSSTANWPTNSVSSGGSLTLSQTVLNLAGGQSASVTASNANGPISITSNSSGGVAIASVFGNTVVITAYNNQGIANITVCDSINACQTINVSVITGANFSLNITSANLNVGQSQTIAITGVGPFYISQNTNTSAVSAVVNGNNLVLNGVSAGGSNVTVCQSSSTCSTVNVYTNAPSGSSASQAAPSGVVTLNPGSVNLSAGGVQNISVSGNSSGQYNVSSNSNSSVASALINGSTLTVTGLTYGTSNVIVCASGLQCGTLNVTVSSSGTTNAPILSPILSSFTVSSNGANNSFMGTGAILTLSFNVNQLVSNTKLTLNGTQVAVNGSGSGPYSASYTIVGSETLPISLGISFTNSSGQSGQAYFSVGNSSVAATSPSVSCPTGYACSLTSSPSSVASSQASSGASSGSFTRYLYIGMTAYGVSDPDVVALQQRLKSDGLFTAAVTGYFGPQTKAAVEAYQEKHGLSALGVVGPSTRALLNKGI